MRCAQCRRDNPVEARFCLECGGRLVPGCAACGQPLPGEARFCMACGAPVAAPPRASDAAATFTYTPRHLAERILASRAALEGERKSVTVLFCDMVRSTALAEQLGPEGMHGLLSRFFETALGEIHRYEDTINQFLGDGFMALFGAPVAHEDHGRHAVLAALDLRRALDQQPLEVEPGRRVPVRLRLGLHTGFVVVGAIGDNLRMDYTAVGDTTHLAARLQQMAEPGQILLSEDTAPRARLRRAGEPRSGGGTRTDRAGRGTRGQRPGRPALEDVKQQACALGFEPVVWRACLDLAERREGSGQAAAGAAMREEARAGLERVAAGLPDDLRAAFAEGPLMRRALAG